MFAKKLHLLLILLLALALGVFGSAAQDDMMDPPPGFDSWDAVVAAADGATINCAIISCGLRRRALYSVRIVAGSPY